MALFNEQKNNERPPRELKCEFVFKCVTLCCSTNRSVAECASLNCHFKLREIQLCIIVLSAMHLKGTSRITVLNREMQNTLFKRHFYFSFIFLRVNWKRNTLIKKGCMKSTVSV